MIEHGMEVVAGRMGKYCSIVDFSHPQYAPSVNGQTLTTWNGRRSFAIASGVNIPSSIGAAFILFDSSDATEIIGVARG